MRFSLQSRVQFNLYARQNMIPLYLTINQEQILGTVIIAQTKPRELYQSIVITSLKLAYSRHLTTSQHDTHRGSTYMSIYESYCIVSPYNVYTVRQIIIATSREPMNLKQFYQSPLEIVIMHKCTTKLLACSGQTLRIQEVVYTKINHNGLTFLNL